MIRYNLILGAVLILTGSWMNASYPAPNISTYHIHIGKKLVFSTTVYNNNLGDTVLVLRKELNFTDTLYASVYLCGSGGHNARVGLTIKDEQGRIMSERSHMNSTLGYSEKMAVKDILLSQPANSSIIAIFFSVENKKEKLNTSFLIGKIKIK